MSAPSEKSGPADAATAHAAWLDKPRSFFRDRAGNVAMMFVFLSLPLCGAIGLAVDVGRVYHVGFQTQAALDAAALAAGRVAQVEKVDTINKASAAATAFFDRAKPSGVVVTDMQFSPNSAKTEFTLTANSWVRTPFMGVLSIIASHEAPDDAPDGCNHYFDCVQVASTATAQICLNCSGDDGTNLEIALVLDMSGSMAGQKTTDLIAAAKDLIDIVVWDDQSHYYSKVAMVPYSMGVNAGTYADKVRGPIAPPKEITAATRTEPVVITSAGHGFNNGDLVYIKDVLGMTQIDNRTFTVANATADTFALSGVNGKSYGSYSSGGYVYCTTPGCEYFAFKNPSGQSKLYRISSCVSERTGANAYTDAAPSTTLLGRNYPASNNPCPTNTIVPLSTDRTMLKAQVDALNASGSTGGHIGVAWGWYLLSPNFGYLWPSESTPAAYGAAKTKKIAVIMTDGEYNSTYCNGVISQDSTSGSGSINDHINCNAPNGLSFDQARAACAGMKAKGVNIEIYTVGFLVVDDQRASDLMSQCATDASHFYVASNGDALKAAFRDIALKISKLRLTN